MNAVTRIKPDESIHGSVIERAHRATISIHCPNSDEMDMAVRCDLAVMRDAATAGMGRASDTAAVILAEVSKVATQAVYASMPTSKLMRVRSALNLTMEAARAVERALRDG